MIFSGFLFKIMSLYRTTICEKDNNFFFLNGHIRGERNTENLKESKGNMQEQNTTCILLILNLNISKINISVQLYCKKP